MWIGQIEICFESSHSHSWDLSFDFFYFNPNLDGLFTVRFKGCICGGGGGGGGEEAIPTPYSLELC